VILQSKRTVTYHAVFLKSIRAQARKEYVLSQGASITGRLLTDGKPVPDAGIGIYGVKGGGFLNSFSVVTDGNGQFTFSGLPANEEFYLFSIMRSLRELGALPDDLSKQVTRARAPIWEI
jgi:hypothetical protein